MMSTKLAITLGCAVGVASTLLIKGIIDGIRVQKMYDEHIVRMFNSVPADQRFDETGLFSEWENGADMPVGTRVSRTWDL